MPAGSMHSKQISTDIGKRSILCWEQLRSMVTLIAFWVPGLVNIATMGDLIQHLLVTVLIIAIIVVSGGLITGRTI